MMAKYKVTITETLKKEIEVEADFPMMAETIAETGWKNERVVLTADDFAYVTFEAEEIKEND